MLWPPSWTLRKLLRCIMQIMHHQRVNSTHMETVILIQFVSILVLSLSEARHTKGRVDNSQTCLGQGLPHYIWGHANISFRWHSSLHPSFSKLSSVALILPVSTADCERDFSTLKRIKTAPRNRLKTQTLDMLIRIPSEKPEITNLLKINFDNAATVWGSKTNKKFIFKHKIIILYQYLNFVHAQ